MKKCNITVASLLFLFLIGMCSFLTINTYAKYRSVLEDKSDSYEVAKWTFDEENSIKTIDIDLDKSYIASTLYTGTIAPGTSGYFNLSLDNSSFVAVDYTIKLLSANVPSNLKFYTDREHNHEFNINNPITGRLEVHGARYSQNIYWEWKYETGTIIDGVAEGDSLDTIDGKNTNDMTITVQITGTQVVPEEV